jgi:hypothetical protein
VGPAFIDFGQDGAGQFRFIAVEGQLDCWHGHRDGRPAVEFGWEGHDDCDPASGRCWAVLEDDGMLSGHIFIYQADHSAFTAILVGQARPRDHDPRPRTDTIDALRFSRPRSSGRSS